MNKWKLIRQQFGSEEYEICSGNDVTLGRGKNNSIAISSIVISRNHCIFKVKDDEVTVTDLKSSNGVYVGLKKITPSIPYSLSENDVIGLGWTIGAGLSAIDDCEKYVFKLIKVKENIIPFKNRIQFQNESESIETPATLKRKLSLSLNIKKEESCDLNGVYVLSDSDDDNKNSINFEIKKIKLETNKQQPEIESIKVENDDIQYDAFTIKQEYIEDDDDDKPILVDSDSDSESENWFLRLSQSSPGKPFTKIPIEQSAENSQETSYSQWDDGLPLDPNEDDIYMQDLIKIPAVPPKAYDNKCDDQLNNEKINCVITNQESNNEPPHRSLEIIENIPPELQVQDRLDGATSDNVNSIDDLHGLEAVNKQNDLKHNKKVQMIEPLCKAVKRKSHRLETKTRSRSKESKSSKSVSSSTKQVITNSQKEERKKKLREIACKDKDAGDSENSINNTNRAVVNIKVTNLNRGAFLTNVANATVKPVKRRESLEKKNEKLVAKLSDQSNVVPDQDKQNKLDETKSVKTKSKRKSKSNTSKEKIKLNKSETQVPVTSKEKIKVNESQTHAPVPIKSVKPLMESDFCFSGKPVSKVEPLKPKKNKKVRFSDVPEVHVFEIEAGNNLKEIKSIKTSLVDSRQMPIFSLEKITLMKVLRWNPHWLDEQANNNEPPPILGHNNTPMALFHSFDNHKQYIQLVGDLLLMEIWECLTQGHLRKRNQQKPLQMQIGNLPPTPPLERCYELFNLSVNLSMPTSEAKDAPRMGDVLMLDFGPEEAKNCRFFFVHNVRTLPAPSNNKNTFFCISLYTTYTERMRLLKPGEHLVGRVLAYINKELMLFEAMEHLSGSPLCDAILKPEPWHFQRNDNDPAISMNSEWTATLNDSQKKAVISTVSAALSDRPSIQMIQGPPGTGKSRVICSIVMSYFYDAAGKRLQNRGKILICATSNAAVDELVIRLLSIRQKLPKQERFRMVRVGRAEAMAARAREVSSQQLAQRDAARPPHDQPAALAHEISHLEAKINMWKTAVREAKDPVRVAYCETRITNLVNRINLLRAGGGGGGAGAGDDVRPERLVGAERRIIDCADIIATTLSSAQNSKMKGVKGRVALCIVDEAGQAIEPETLAPLALLATRLALVGDPQQLPGFICSQRAKKHGLGESLFARLTSCAEQWASSPVVLLEQQYRMHPAIADYPNRAFYGARVSTVPRAPLNWDIPPYMIIGISSGDKGQSASGANEMEAAAVARLAGALAGAVRARRLSLAVITPYAAHRDLVRRHLRHLEGSDAVEVNTVDSFQGQERDVVVVSLARSHGLGFLADAGRMNVALTRARHSLLVCLNPLAVTKNSQWRTLMEDAQARKLYTTLPIKMCRMPAAGRDEEDILKYITTHKR